MTPRWANGLLTTSCRSRWGNRSFSLSPLFAEDGVRGSFCENRERRTRGALTRFAERATSPRTRDEVESKPARSDRAPPSPDRLRPVDQPEPGDHQQCRRAERRRQLVVQDEIARDHAEQRRDEGEGRELARRIGLHQRKPHGEGQPDHPDRLIGDDARSRAVRACASASRPTATPPRRESESRSRPDSPAPSPARRAAASCPWRSRWSRPTSRRRRRSGDRRATRWQSTLGCGTPIASATPAKLSASPAHCEARSRSPRMR